MRNGIGGGQGRRPSELQEEALWFGVCMVAIVLLMIVAVMSALGGA